MTIDIERKYNGVTITSKNGTDITLAISGTQEAPKITADRFEIAGNQVYGAATILPHFRKNDGSEPGLLFRDMPQNIYIQCADAMPAILAAIAELPHKQYWARKVDDTVDADGDRCLVTRWEFDRMLQTERGTVITEGRMGDFLDSKDITEIEIADAVRMWAEEKEEAHIKANEAGNKRAKAIFDDDEADAGYTQACENAGIPKELR